MQQMKERHSESLSTLATMYGCCGLFDLCGDDDLMSLSFQGSEPFLDWIGWNATDLCEVKRNFINWVRPEYSGGNPTPGYSSDPCAPANSVEFGVCDFTVNDFGRLRRAGPTRDLTKNAVRYCDRQPRYRLDGSRINDEREWTARIATEGIMQDIKRMVITGNDATPGQFDGLRQLVKTGYTNSDGSSCASMDSIVINWNGNTMSGGAGITWNGDAVAATYNFVDVLRSVVRRIKQRIKWSPTLASQNLRVGDMILLLPDFLAQCLLDFFTCWSVCDGSQYNEVQLNSLEGRSFRDQLNGGLFGDGRIFIDGFEIPLLTYDWELITNAAGTQGQIFLLTGSVGNVKTLEGEYNDMRLAVAGYPEAGMTSTDGGRLLWWISTDETCVRQSIEIQPRLVSWAPFLNAVFNDVQCQVPGGAMSPDPTSSFFIETSFTPAAC